MRFPFLRSFPHRRLFKLPAGLRLLLLSGPALLALWPAHAALAASFDLAVPLAPVLAEQRDVFAATRALLELNIPGVGTRQVLMGGPSEVVVRFAGPNQGDARDADRDGLDDVDLEMVRLELRGSIAGIGPVILRLDPTRPTVGQMEETANKAAGVLDLPPFSATGTADSFFDVFFEVELPNRGLVLHNQSALRVEASLAQTPPEVGRHFLSRLGCIRLLDASNADSGIDLCKARHTPNPFEKDAFAHTLAHLTIEWPGGSQETVVAVGPTEINVDLGQTFDFDSDGLESVPTQITRLELKGWSSLGLLSVRRHPTPPFEFVSFGEIEELANTQPDRLDVPPFAPSGLADSFFDVFVEVDVPVLRPPGARSLAEAPSGEAPPRLGTLHNNQALRLNATLRHKPPGPGEMYLATQRIQLFDTNNKPTNIFLVREKHTPHPIIEVDPFPEAVGHVLLQLPDGSQQWITGRGPAKLHAYFDGATEGSAQDDDGDGREEVLTELVGLELSGGSPLGRVQIGLRNDLPSLGQIEEQQGNTAGTLDLDPFKPGLADSFFDVFFEIEVGGQVWHTDLPARLQTVLTHKPAAPGEVFVSPADEKPLELLDASGKPSGHSLLRAVFIPNPSRLEVVRGAGGQAELCWPLPSLDYLLQSAASPAGAWEDSGLPATVKDGRHCVSLDPRSGTRFFRLIKRLP
ncbi:MAG: hypothetical protein HYY24_02635 [Verrucomicrobia bacterium]|nr:hypothetical protein [Verrucomicrobiota bacterium]